MGAALVIFAAVMAIYGVLLLIGRASHTPGTIRMMFGAIFILCGVLVAMGAFSGRTAPEFPRQGPSPVVEITNTSINSVRASQAALLLLLGIVAFCSGRQSDVQWNIHVLQMRALRGGKASPDPDEDDPNSPAP